MKRTLQASLMTLVLLLPAAQTRAADPDPAMNAPDQVAWELFVQVNAPAATQGNNNVLFETWASDGDTFTQNPQWPGTAPSPKVLKVPALIARAPRQPGLEPRVLPGGTEEVRRNKTTFDFIVQNKLYLTSGLVAAFKAGIPISFPIDSIEVKANWKPITPGMDTSSYHVNTASDGKQYALVSMHIISKAVPNWTWATFEHKDNAGRCDYIGCSDKFGAVVQFVAPKTPLGGQYPACAKTAAVKKLFSDGKLDSVFDNYCLKGSQTDFITATGLVTRLGNSVTEHGFVDSSSCMTCHSRAAFNAGGQDVYGAGFIGNASPNGAPLASWFWNNPGKPNQTMKAMQADFVWAIPLNAIGP
jgi:hypothetical protein